MELICLSGMIIVFVDLFSVLSDCILWLNHGQGILRLSASYGPI